MKKYNPITKKWEDTDEVLIDKYGEKIQKALYAKNSMDKYDPEKYEVVKGTNIKKSWFNNWFKTPKAFEDGYDFGDVTKTILGTGGKVATEFTRGILNIGEGIGDTINYGISWGADKLGAHEFAENLKNETKKDLFNSYLKPNDEIYGKNSITDSKTDNIVNSLGYMYGLYATAGLGSTTASQTAISTAVTFESSYGHALSEAYNAGASDKDARRYALISASAEAGSELMFGGIGKGSKAIGISRSAIPVDDKVAKFASDRFKSTFAKNLTQWAIKSGGEGLEEVVSGTFSALGKKLTYMKDEDFKKILKDEQLLDQFISGAISAGISSGTGMVKATKAGQDYISGRTDAEQQIYDKMVENKTNELKASKNNELKQKEIDKKVDEIIEQKKEKFKNAKIDEKAIRAEVENNIDFDDSTIKLSKKEIAKINEQVDEAFEKGKLNLNDIYETFTPEETNKIARLEKELQNKNLTEEAKNGYEKELLETIKQRNETLTNESEKNMFLRHTLYNEEQRATNFELTKEEKKLVESDEKLKNLYDDAVKYGNNSEEAHKFVNALAKMSTQTEYQYRLTDTKELNQLGYKVSNKNAVINGLHDGDNKTIYINMDSDNALNVVVGHETGHIFENTQEYKELQEMLFKVAEEDGTLDARRKELEELYKNVKNADIDMELTNDLLGEKLFTDEKFIERLAEKPNLFTKIKDKIDDLVIKFKGTEEEKKLREIQNKFLEVYRRNDLQKYVAEADAQAKKNKKNSTEKNVELMLGKLTNGEYYSDISNNLINMDSKDQSTNVQNVLENLDGKIISTIDGDKIIVLKNIIGNKKIKNVINELQYGPTRYKRIKKDISKNELKRKVLMEIEEQLEISKFKKNITDTDGRHKDLNINSFDTREALVYDGENMYKVKYDVALLNSGEKVAYDIKDIYSANSNLEYLDTKKMNSVPAPSNKEGVLGSLSSFDSTISQKDEKSKSTKADYSLSKKSDIQGLEDYSRDEIKNIAKDYIKEALLYSDIEADIKDMEIIGSRNRGTANDNSDLDLVVELDGENLREDDLFNVLNDSEEPLEINGIKVDINPIVNYRSGTLEEFMKRSNQYDQDILKNQKLAPIKTNNLNEYIADVSAREAKQNALDKESVRQSIMDYLEENNITNPTKEDMMNAFDDYDVMDNSDTLNDANKAEKLYSEVADEILKENNSKYSLSVKEANTGKDNDGNKLSKGQMEKFADSKITDKNGNLIKVYHTTGGIDVPFSSVQFNEFNPVGTPYYRFGDQVVNFFTDSKEMSGSYVDQQYVEADTTKITSVEQAESVIDYYNSSDLIEYTLKKNGRKYELYDERAEEVIHTFNSKEDLFKNITQVVQEESQLTDLWGEDAKGYQYNGYLNITNPYIVQNEKATNWNEVGKDYGEDLKEFYNNLTQNEKDMIKDVMGWEDWGIFKDELTRYYNEKYIKGTGDYAIPDNYKETLANLGKKLHDLYARDDSINVPYKALSDIYDIASDDFSEKSIEKYAYRNKTTNDIVFDVLEMNKNGSNYDGVVFENILDYGGEYDGERTPANVYVTFNSNQFKSADNKAPTDDADIRYSLSKNNNTELNNYLEKNNFKLDNNGSLEYKELSNKQINSLVSIYRKNGYSDVSADYLRERLKESGRLKIPREVADRFIEKELGYKPEIDTTKVFEDAEGNKLTKNQVEFYKDSDVRDIRGRLIPVYHRTNAEFTIFDKKAGKQHGNKYGRGFYFSINPENYGNNEMKVYLNAKDGEYKYIPDMGYYIVQEPNMIKNVDNLNPTSNEDIRYSISKKGKLVDNKGNDVRLDVSDAGNTGTLMAIHNLNAEKLNGIIDLGGFPVPSIAITNPDIVNHKQFGNISVLFDKSTIDPANRLNEVYDRDVWSPTFPTIEYEINDDGIEKVAKNLGIEEWKLRDAVEDNSKPEYLIERLLREEQLIDKYVKDNNINYETTYKDAETKVDMHQSGEKIRQFIIDNDFDFKKLYKNKKLQQEYFDLIKDYYDNSTFPQAVKENLYNEKISQLKDFIDIQKGAGDLEPVRQLKKYQDDFDLIKSGENKIIDEWQTNKNKKDVAVENGIEDYLKNQIKDVYGDKGIRNDREIFTPSGNRRSFWQLHDEYNLENIVDALTKGDTTGTQNWFAGYGQIQANMANQFNSISDIKANENRLTSLAENNTILEEARNNIENDIDEIVAKNDTDINIASELLADFARGDLTIDNFKELTRNYYQTTQNVSDELINKIIDDLNNLKDLPTDYFEAKPQRAVGLDEIQSVVLPTSTDESLKNKLKELNIDYVEYNPEVEGDRQRVINQFDNLKFSLSRKNNLAPIRGDYQVYSKDIRNNNLAPIREDITKKPASKNVNYSLLEEPAESEVDYSAFDDMLPIKNELERLDAKEEERLRKKREKYQQQIEQAKKVSKQKKSEFRKNYDNFKTLFINENAEVDNLAKESGNKKLTYKADMLNNYVVEAENDINNYQTDYNGKEIGKSVKQLFEPAKNKGLYEAFNDYLINWSNIDRHKYDKGSLRSADTSRRMNSIYEMDHPEFKKWAKDVWQYGKNALNTMEQSGLIDSKLKQRLTEMYPHYVPFMDNADLNMYIGANDEIVPKKTIKSAKGGMSTTEMLPMEDALTRYAYSYRKSMRQNDLYSEIVKTLRANEIDTGMDVREEATDLQDSLYRDENGNYLKAYIDGDTKVVSISNDLYRALQNDLKNQVKDLEDRLSLITKPLQKATRIKGNLVTSWSPTFIFKNFFKDFQDAMFNSTDTKKFIKNYPSAFNELRKNDTKLVRQFRAMYGSAVGQYTGSDTGAMKQATKTKNPFKKFANANEIIELAPRYAEFKASLENGATIEEAMYNAREVTTNFSRGGTITKAINRNGFNFVNASTQGLSKFIRNFTGQNGAKGFTHALLKAVEFGVAPALFNELVFGSGDDKDEDYDALPDYVKDNYYLFKYGDNKFIRIPKGRALSVFGSGARRTLEYINGEKDAFDGYGTNVWNQIGINNPEESFLFTPIMQAKNNKAWYGGDIVPTRLQDKPAGEQYDEKTDAFSKWLGKTLNISPKKINYVIDQYSGGLGDIALPFITPEAQSEYDNPAGRALAPIRDQFVVNSIDDNKYVSDFYTNNDKLKVQANSEYATDEDALRYKYSNSVSSELSALYKEKRLIQNDSSLSNSEKYKKAQAIKQQINEIAKEGLDNYKKVNVVGNYAEVNDKEYYRNNKGEWTKAKEEDIEEMNKFGLTANEKNNYYNSKNNISNITSRYKSLSENATDEEKTQLSTLKKNDIINTIKATNISNDAKAYLYSKYYSSADKMNVISTLDISMDKYLDFELQNFKADKNIYGQTIKNSKKTKMINYINNMSGTYGEKIIIYKLNNMSDNSYNQDIVNYINRQNISMEEKRTLLKALGMKVDYAGNVRW